MPAMRESLSRARTCASRWNRVTRSGSRENSSGRILIATSRFSFVSVARYTSPMPPLPSKAVISYEPSGVPIVMDKVQLPFVWFSFVDFSRAEVEGQCERLPKTSLPQPLRPFPNNERFWNLGILEFPIGLTNLPNLQSSQADLEVWRFTK